MHKAKIVDIGEMVPAFEEEKLIILFGTQVTPELQPICVVHEELEKEANPLRLGGKITVGTKEYEIKALGDLANKNFEELGHISIYFRDEETEVLPGAVVVAPEDFPSFAVGDEITIS